MTTDYYTPAARQARAAAERATSGWSWENNPRRRLAMIRQVLAHKGRTCHLCGLPGATTADHVVPRTQGGRNVLDNLEPAHASCNMVRKDLPLPEWFARHPLAARRRKPSREW
jgi:5-methylcytosine-specific restriction endonuclease McrA